MTLPPSPAGLRVVTLPRERGEKPQEAAVAVNPRDRDNVIVSYHQARGEGGDHHPGMPVHVYVASSRDGGMTWAVADTTHMDYRVSIDATVAFDVDGNALLIYMGMDRISASTRAGEYFFRSSDGGRTWGKPVTLAEASDGDWILNHMPNLAADNSPDSPYVGKVYAVWDRQAFEPGPQIALRYSEMVIVHSTDGGTTWSEPTPFSQDPTTYTHTTAVANDGTVYVMYAISRFAGQGDFWLADVDYDMVVAVSRDGGETFEGPFPVTSTQSRSAQVTDFPRGYGFPVFAIDPRGSGRLFVTWGDYRYGDRDVFLTTSEDGGRSWSDPVRVNDDAVGNGKDQIMQWLAVDPINGAAYVVFYDRRADPENVVSTVTLARSTDGGHTFANYTLSTASSDARHACLGDYLGLAARDGRVYVAWIEDVADPPRQWEHARQEPAPGEFVVDDKDFPVGPTAIRVGIVDFK